MANKKSNNNEEKNAMNNKEEKKMAKAMKKITVSMANGQIMITKIDGKAVDEPRRFGVYSGNENTLPRISIRPKVGGWMELTAHVVEDENGKLSVEAVREPDAYWGFAEVILGGKKNVNAAKKALIEARKNAIAKKQTEQSEQNNNGIIIGATTHGYVYSKPMASAQEEVIDLSKFGSRLMKWGKGLDCSKIFKEKEEVARIFWQKSGDPAKIRLMGEEEKRYYMLSYTKDDFIYFNEKKEKVVVNDQALRNALWFFYKNFVVRLAELKGWKLPEKKVAYYQDNGYWDSLEKEYEAEEAARAAKKKA